jgi:hypothetical protein
VRAKGEGGVRKGEGKSISSARSVSTSALAMGAMFTTCIASSYHRPGYLDLFGLGERLFDRYPGRYLSGANVRLGLSYLAALGCAD